jgi:nucleoid-associated protein YgaU
MNEEYKNEYQADDLDSEDQDLQESKTEASEANAGAESSAQEQEWGFETKKKKLSKEVVLGFTAIAVMVGVFGMVVYDKIKGDDEKFVEANVGADDKKDDDKQKKEEDNKKIDPFDDSKQPDKELFAQDNTTNKQDSIFGQQDEPKNDLDADDLFDDNNTAANQRLIDRQNVFGPISQANNIEDTRIRETSTLFQGPLDQDNTQLITREQLDNDASQTLDVRNENNRSPFDSPLPLIDDESKPAANNPLDNQLLVQQRDTQLDSKTTGLFSEPQGMSIQDNNIQVNPFAANSAKSDSFVDPQDLSFEPKIENITNGTDLAINPFGSAEPSFDPSDRVDPGQRSLSGDVGRVDLVGDQKLDFEPRALDNNSSRLGSFDQPAIASQQLALSGGTYIIQDGDSYWKISKTVYGTSKHFQALADYNKHLVKDPKRLKPQTSILTPSIATLTGQPETVAIAGIEPSIGNNTTFASSTQSVSNSAAGTTVRRFQPPAQGIFFSAQGNPMYRIGKNDTLTTIADEHLGRWSRWQQIYQMNRDQLDDPNKLKLKMIIRLPADASTTPLVSRGREIR